MKLIADEPDSSIAFYEQRNVTRGGNFYRVNLDQGGVFTSPLLQTGERNLLQFRAVDFAGNVSETVNVELFESSVRELSPAGANPTVLALSTYHNETALLSPSECVVDSSGGTNTRGGRGFVHPPRFNLVAKRRLLLSPNR